MVCSGGEKFRALVIAVVSNAARERNPRMDAHGEAAPLVVTSMRYLPWVSADTTPDAAAVRSQIYRRMSSDERCLLAARMSVAARAISLDGIRSRHPEYDPDQARWALFRLLLGDGLFRRVWPVAPVLAP